MVFEGSKAVLIKSLSGTLLAIDSSGYVVTDARISGIVIDDSGRLAVNNPLAYTVAYSPATLQVTDVSGGAPLASGVADLVTIQTISALSGNATFVGTSGDPPWQASHLSGKGFRLYFGGTFYTPPVVTVPAFGNMNNIRVVSTTSGQEVSYVGIQ